MSPAIRVLNGTKFNEELVLTTALLTITSLSCAEMYKGRRWSGYDTYMSLSVKVMAFVASKTNLAIYSSTARQLGPAFPDLAAIVISAYMAVILGSEISSSWLNNVLNRWLCWCAFTVAFLAEDS